MKKRTVYQIDAFTKEKFKGNPAGVITNAEGLTDDQMQQIARELNNSETAFIFPADEIGDGTIRYFTPTVEVPICGHATIAAMYAKAIEENLDSCTLTMKTGAGILPFEVIRSSNTIKIKMTQGTITFSKPFHGGVKNQIIKYLGLKSTDINELCPIQIVSTGHSKVMIGINNNKVLNHLTPDFLALSELSKTIECNGYYVFTFDAEEDGCLVNGRMFAPAIGINEDPVTGNANGPLGAYLVHNNIVKHDGEKLEFKIKQGEAMGRTGYINVHVTIDNNQPQLVQIVGEATVVFKTEIIL